MKHIIQVGVKIMQPLNLKFHFYPTKLTAIYFGLSKWQHWLISDPYSNGLLNFFSHSLHSISCIIVEPGKYGCLVLCERKQVDIAIFDDRKCISVDMQITALEKSSFTLLFPHPRLYWTANQAILIESKCFNPALIKTVRCKCKQPK